MYLETKYILIFYFRTLLLLFGIYIFTMIFQAVKVNSLRYSDVANEVVVVRSKANKNGQPKLGSNDANIVSNTSLTIGNQDEVRHVAFLKVHKTASSTAQNIFLRFGNSRKLNFVLPHTKGESGWLNVISYNKSITETNVLLPPSGSHFDLLCCHVLYNRNAFEAVLPQDTVYIGIVREPISRFQSAVKWFSPGYILRLPGQHPLSTYSENPLKYDHNDPKQSQTNNRMAVEFDFPMEVFPGKSLNGSKEEIDKYLKKVDEEFRFIIISEFFEESVVYMRRLLKWSLRDILYTEKNASPKVTNMKKKLQERDGEKLRSFLYLDIALYEFALKRFHEQVAKEGEDFENEVKHFKEIRAQVNEYCKGNKNKPFSIGASPWNTKFEIDGHECTLYSKHEKDLIQKQRMRMYGTYDN